MSPEMQKPTWVKILSLFAILFGLTTIVEGGRTLFTETGIRAAGDIIPSVLWFNFIAGFFYVLAGIGIYKRKFCAKIISTAIALSSLVILVFLIVQITQGHPYEKRTLIAMQLRTYIWIAIALAAVKSKVFNSISCKY